MAETWDEQGRPISGDQAETWDENGNPIRKPPNRQSRGVAQNPLIRDITGAAASVRASFPGTDELQGAIKGVAGAARGFVDPSSGGVSVLDTADRDGISLQDRMRGAAGGYQREYGKEVATERELRGDFAERRPFTSFGLQLPTAAVVGGPAARFAGQGGNLLVRAGKGAAAGGVIGGIYGAASEGNLEQRGQSALMGAGTGAAFGGALPVAGRMYGQKLNALATPAAVGVNSALGGAAGYYAADMMGLPEEERGDWAKTGAMIGGGTTLAAPFARNALASFRPQGVTAAPPTARTVAREEAPPPGNAPRGPGPAYVGAPATTPRPPVSVSTPTPVREAVDDSLLRMASRRGVTPEKLDEIASEAEATGRNPLMAQVLGEPGLQRLQTNASLPGKTPQLASDTIRAQRAGQSARISADVDEALGTGTRTQARGQIANTYEEIAPQYNELLGSARITPQAEASIDRVLSRVPQSELQPIKEAANRIAQYDGLAFDQLPPAQKLHYIKMGMGQRVGAMGREGLQGVERQRLTAALGEFRKELESAVPGYRQLNGRWADNVQAEEAISWADDLFASGKNALEPEEARAAWQAMSPAQKQTAMTSIRVKMRQMIEERARLGQRSTNVADPFLSEAFQRRLQTVIGDDAAASLLRKLRVEDRSFAELGTALPRTNAKTAPLFADMVDQMTMAPTSPRNMLTQGAEFLWRKATNPLLEGFRNKEGAALLREMSPAQIRALLSEIKKRDALRQKRTIDATRAGAFGGMASDQ